MMGEAVEEQEVTLAPVLRRFVLCRRVVCAPAAACRGSLAGLARLASDRWVKTWPLGCLMQCLVALPAEAWLDLHLSAVFSC